MIFMGKTIYVNRTKTLIIKEPRYKKDFVQIPFAILRNHGITPIGKALYSDLLSYAWYEDECFPSQERLAWDLGVSVRTIQRVLNELRAIGLIDWKVQGLNQPNIYSIEKIPQRVLTYNSQKEFEFKVYKVRKKGKKEIKTEVDTTSVSFQDTAPVSY